VTFENWTSYEKGSEVQFTRAESPFRFCVEDGCWVCDYGQLHCSGFGDSPEEALEDCLEQMREQKILLDAAVAVGVGLLETGRI